MEPKVTVKTLKDYIAERRIELAKHMHVAESLDGFFILEIPSQNGSPFTVWPGTFRTRRAAELFLEDLLDACSRGTPEAAIRTHDFIKEFEMQDRVMEILEEHLEAHEGIVDPGALARELCMFRPWEEPDDEEEEIAF